MAFTWDYCGSGWAVLGQAAKLNAYLSCGEPDIGWQPPAKRVPLPSSPCNMYPLTGYEHPGVETLDELVACLDHPALPLLQWSDEYSFVEGRWGPARRTAAAAHQATTHACPSAPAEP
jgi:hypothetical protein